MKHLIWLALLMSGCVSVYAPSAQNSPLFRKAGEVQGSVGFGNGLDAQGAVAVTNHIGVMANFNYQNHQTGSYSYNPDNDDYQFHRFLESGLGYYMNKRDWCYEIYAGYGKGQGSKYGAYYWGDPQAVKSTGKYDRIFVQPAFGMNKGKFHFSMVFRTSIVDFKEFRSSKDYVELHENPKVFLEPAFLGRLNLLDNHAFLKFQVGVCYPTAVDTYDYRPVQISGGVGFRFGGIHLKDNSPSKGND